MSLWANVPAAAPLPTGLLDAVVVGGGPAGYTAGLYLARALAHPVVLAGAGASQLADADIVENFPGFPGGIGGQELMQRMREQAEGAGADVRTLDAVRVRLAVASAGGAPVHEVETAEGTLRTRSLVLATGSASKRLGLDGEDELIGRGIAFCAVCEAPLFSGRSVVVVGGGDSAMEEALALSAHADRVHLVHRNSTFRAAPVLVERVRQTANITVATDTVVTAVAMDASAERLESVTLESAGTRSELDVDGLFIAIGHEPRVELADGALALTAAKHLHVDGPGGATSVPGVFAAGDVMDERFRQAVTAAGAGCAAALEAQRYLQHTGE